MVNGGIECSNPRILDAIRYHKLGVLVEVTNGITSPAKRQWKKRQVRGGRALLQKSVGDSAKIFGGLALIKDTEKRIRELDFLIQIKDYNLSLSVLSLQFH